MLERYDPSPYSVSKLAKRRPSPSNHASHSTNPRHNTYQQALSFFGRPFFKKISKKIFQQEHYKTDQDILQHVFRRNISGEAGVRVDLYPGQLFCSPHQPSPGGLALSCQGLDPCGSHLHSSLAGCFGLRLYPVFTGTTRCLYFGVPRSLWT